MLRKQALINFYSKEVMKMWRDSEQILDSVFLSYNKILKRLKLLGITTKHGKEVKHIDLRKAVDVMLKKHPKKQLLFQLTHKLQVQVENILF